MNTPSELGKLPVQMYLWGVREGKDVFGVVDRVIWRGIVKDGRGVLVLGERRTCG